jgi:hypothetical protein
MHYVLHKEELYQIHVVLKKMEIKIDQLVLCFNVQKKNLILIQYSNFSSTILIQLLIGENVFQHMNIIYKTYIYLIDFLLILDHL